jgi:hypothetical protein
VGGRQALAAAVSLSLVFVAPATAGFQIGITESRIQPASIVSALGESIQRYDVYWSGQSTYTGTIAMTPGLRPVVAVFGTASYVPTDARSRSAYVSFVRSLLARYPQVRDVVVWNEPYRGHTFWGDHDYEVYADLLEAASPVIRQMGARVLGPGLRPMAAGDAAQLIAAIAGRNPYLLDIWTIHAYTMESNEAALISQVRTELGWRIPFWIAEDGLDTQPPPAFAGLYFGFGPAASELDQAAAVPWMIRQAYCAGADVWMNFELWDDPNLARWQSGFLRPNGSQKPAFAAAVKASADARANRFDCGQPSPAPPGIATSLTWRSTRGAFRNEAWNAEQAWNGGYPPDHLRPRVEQLLP